METHTPPQKWSQKLGIGGLAILACIAVALCGLVGSPRAAHAAVGDYGTLEDGTYTISSAKSPVMNWDVTDGSTSDEAKIQSYPRNATAAQVWKITTDSNGYSTIVNVKSGKALDVPGGTVANDKQLQQYTPNGTKAQKWKIIERSTGYKIVSAVDESYVIDLYAGSTNSKAPIQLYQDNSTAAQRWLIDKVADENTETVDKTALFDTSVYLTDTQPGTITWETVPSGWANTAIQSYSDIVVNNGIAYTSASYYSGSDATPVARIDKCCKMNGQWVSVRLTFSNISSIGQGTVQGRLMPHTSLGFEDDNIWKGLWVFNCDFLDINIELFYTDTGETISLEGAFFSGSSLNAPYPDYGDLGESVRYLTDKTVNSYVLEETGVDHRVDGSWCGTTRLWEYEPWDDIDAENFMLGGMNFMFVDEKPTLRYGSTQKNHSGRFNFNLSPLTIATPPSPTKSVEITG